MSRLLDGGQKVSGVGRPTRLRQAFGGQRSAAPSVGGTGGVTRAQARSLVGRDAHNSAVAPDRELAAILAVAFNNTGNGFIERGERFVAERAA